MKKIAIISLLLLSSISFIIYWTFIENLLCRDSQFNIIESSGANYVCSYYGDGDFDNDFYYMNKSLSIKDGEQKVVAEVLMYKNSTIYTFKPFKTYSSLEKNEAVVSKNVANEYGLKVGSVLTVSSSLYDNSFDYYVKAIIEPAYCFTEEYFVPDRGIVLVGNFPNIVEKNNLSLAFVDDTENLTDIALQKLTSLKSYGNSLKKDIVLNMGLVVGIGCLVFGAYFILFEVASSHKIRKSIINGYCLKKLFTYYLNPILWAISYSLLIAVFTFIESYILFGGLLVSISLLLLLVLPVVACILSFISLKMKMRRL